MEKERLSGVWVFYRESILLSCDWALAVARELMTVITRSLPPTPLEA